MKFDAKFVFMFARRRGATRDVDNVTVSNCDQSLAFIYF